MDINELTVIASTNNEERNLPKFLASLPPNVQLILVDSSSDNTASLAMELRPENTTVFCRQMAPAQARNFASVKARTHWLLFTYAHGEFASDYFTNLANIKAQGAVYGMKQDHVENTWYSCSFSSWQSRLDRLGIPVVSGSNFVVERYVFHDVSGFDPHLHVNEDIEIGCRIKRARYPIKFAPALIVLAFERRRRKKGSLRKDIYALTRYVSIHRNLYPTLSRWKDWNF